MNSEQCSPSLSQYMWRCILLIRKNIREDRYMNHKFFKIEGLMGRIPDISIIMAQWVKAHICLLINSQKHTWLLFLIEDVSSIIITNIVKPLVL